MNCLVAHWVSFGEALWMVPGVVVLDFVYSFAGGPMFYGERAAQAVRKREFSITARWVYQYHILPS